MIRKYAAPVAFLAFTLLLLFMFLHGDIRGLNQAP